MKAERVKRKMELLEALRSGKPVKKEKAKTRKKKVDDDSKADKKDLSLARKAVEATKKIVKKKDK